MSFKLKTIWLALSFISFIATFISSSAVTPDEALTALIHGNKEYIENASCKPITKKARTAVATVQKPFAVVLGCSDSRVPPEVVFNKLGLGKIFVIRNAGNIVDDIVLGSIEYAIKHLKAPLIMVLGHERCGAVTAAVDAKIKNQKASHHVKYIIDAINPIFNTIKIPSVITNKLKTSLIEKSIKENVRNVMNKLTRRSSIISVAVAAGEVKIVGGYYDLDDGDVKIIS